MALRLRNGEFLQRIAAWHGLLQHSTGRNYALYLDDSIEFGAALIGAWQAGKTIWLTADTLGASIESLKNSVDGFLGEFPQECAPLLPGIDDAAQPVDAATVDGDFAALVVHTSGTTGAAQAIPKRLAQLSNEVATLEGSFGRAIGDADVIGTVSHQHIYGLLFRVLWPLAAGRAMHAHSRNFPEELAEALALHPCVLIASPAHLKRLPDHLDWRGATACVRAVFSSGGPLPLDIAQATARLLGQAPIEVYGSSETGGIAWRQRSAGADESWLPFPRVEWRIADGDGESLLEVRSPNLADANWLRLADRVQAHGADRFLLNGRGDRIVKIEEKRISLDAIEALLAASPLVAAARVVLCDEAPGQRQQLAAFVVASEAGAATLVRSRQTRPQPRIARAIDRQSGAGGLSAPLALPGAYAVQRPRQDHARAAARLAGHAPARAAVAHFGERSKRAETRSHGAGRFVLLRRPFSRRADIAGCGATRLGHRHRSPPFPAATAFQRRQRAQVSACDPAGQCGHAGVDP